jgi:Mor family transcriptional regulator
MDTVHSSTSSTDTSEFIPAGLIVKRRGAKPKTDRNLSLAFDYDNGMSLEGLAEKYSLKLNSTKALIMRFRRLGLVRRRADGRLPQHTERDAEIYRRFAEIGRTTQELADEYGMTAANVSRIVSDTELAREHGDSFIYLPVPREVAVSLSEGHVDPVVTSVLYRVSRNALSR